MRAVDRVLAFLYALLVTGTFVVVRNARDLEDTPFLVALCAAAAFAFALTVISGALLRKSAGRIVLGGLGALALVPFLYLDYLVLYTVAVCMIGGKTCYS